MSTPDLSQKNHTIHIEHTVQSLNDYHTEWNNETERDFKQIHEYLIAQSDLYAFYSRKNNWLDKGLQIGIMVSSALTVVVSSANIMCDTKQIITITTGVFTACLGGVSTLFGF